MHGIEYCCYSLRTVFFICSLHASVVRESSRLTSMKIILIMHRHESLQISFQVNIRLQKYNVYPEAIHIIILN
jgi:hypothetical protein